MAPTTLQKAERERDSVKTTLQWLESKLSSHSSIPLSETKVNHYITMVSSAHEKVISTHETICSQAPPDMDPYNAEYLLLLDSVSDLQCGLEELRRSFIPTATPNPAGASVAEMRLPRLELPTFNGNLQDWIPFKDIFTSTVHSNTQLSKAQKLTYLKTSLVGEAAMQIKAFSLSDANYDIAWTQLAERYHNDRELLFSILHRFVSQPIVQAGSSGAIRSLIDVSKECIRSLDVLKRQVNHWDDILLFHIHQKLDHSSKELWEQTLKDSSIPSLKELLDFLEQRARALAARGSSNPKTCKTEGIIPKKVNVHHAQSFVLCKLCSNNHPLYKCAKFNSMAVSERTEFAKKVPLCFNCLREGHSSTKCNNPKKCHTCEGRHHTMLHRKTFSESTTPSSSLVLNHHSNDKVNIQQTILATALVKVQDHSGQFLTLRALLDGGSTASFATESCIQRLALPRTPKAVQVSGLAVSSVGKTNGNCSMVIKPHFNSENSYVVNCLILSRVTGQLPIHPCDPSVWPHLQGIQLADPAFHKPAHIDLLLGSDIFWNLLLDGRRKLTQDSPIGIQSTLGWLIAGNTSSSCSEIVVHFGEATLDERVRQFWEIESIPTKRLLTEEEIKCEEHFENNYTRNETGRFTVSLPFKNPPVAVGYSYDVAVHRLKQLERRFIKEPDSQRHYVEFMNEYLSLSHMEQVPASELQTPRNPVCYIPHHYVRKDSSTTTKFRVVFDASAKTSTNTSLNEALMVGPTLQENLTSILMKFRTHVIAFTADIAKMYRQVRVTEGDADMQRILWRTNPSEPIQAYRLLTVTYGTASAPYLATKTLQQLANIEQQSFPLASEVLHNDFYVDDVMSGATSVQSALEVQSQLLTLTSRGGFELRKWSSNSTELLESLPTELRETKQLLHIESDPTIKALGVFWNPSTDTFLFKLTLTDNEENVRLTKRQLLSEVSKIFDPMGWLAPVVIRAKIMLQKLWTFQISWDDFIPTSVQGDWDTFRNNLQCIETLSINRCILPPQPKSINLCGFCDSSESAYAAVVYLCVYFEHSTPCISVVNSKTRVAPIKTINLPKLELCGALLLSQLMQTVESSLKIKIDKKRAWSDSTVVLSWISAHPSRWKTFVANRVTEIQSLLPADLWSHVKGTENPADCASRGIDPTELQSHPLWWHGPNWLQNEIYPTETVPFDDSPETLAEERTKVVCNTAIITDTSLFKRFSSLRTLKRVTAWILRFIENCKSKCSTSTTKPVHGILTATELKNALCTLARTAQCDVFRTEIQCLKEGKTLPVKSSILCLNPYIDSAHVLRVGGRLGNSSLPDEQRNPILLPRHHPFTQLIILSTHLKHQHAGAQLILAAIQKTFWITRAKDAIRHQVRKCVVCTRHQATTMQQLMGNLPSHRVTPSPAFTKCGIDYAGPFTLRAIPSRSKVSFKAYLALFVCFTTRAIHLEVVSDLSTPAFLAALKRFIARRGRPTDIFSDCGTNFVGAANEMKQMEALVKNPIHNQTIANLLTDDGTQWHFNPPGAPHMGGLWEAGVKSAKFHLHRVLGSARLTFEEMTTITAQIEATLNSRPLTPISTDLTDLTALTPGHFLIGSPLTALPDADLRDEKIGHLSRWQHLQQLSQHFWHRWSNEYLTRLQQRPKWLKRREEITIGDLVLIKDDRLPPLKWRLGRVTELHPGSDGITRVVTLHTAEGTIKRPIVKICLLPINSDFDNDPPI